MPSARFQISMILAILVGLAYVGWLAWTEGWRLWAVLGVMVLVALIGGAVHMAMGLARAHDGLETGVEDGVRSEGRGESSRPPAQEEVGPEGERAP